MKVGKLKNLSGIHRVLCGICGMPLGESLFLSLRPLR